MSRCFSCGKILRNINAPCPECGYFFTADDNRGCPDKESSICVFTKKVCNFLGPFGKCPIKNEAERECDI